MKKTVKVKKLVLAKETIAALRPQGAGVVTSKCPPQTSWCPSVLYACSGEFPC